MVTENAFVAARREPSPNGSRRYPTMDRQVLEQRLLQAERNASLGFEVIAEQRQIVAGLDTWGLNSIAARRMLQVFEAMQERLLDDLEAAQVQLDAENQIRRRGT